MAHVIEATDCLDAWKKCTGLLMANSQRECGNLITVIENPHIIPEDAKLYDPSLIQTSSGRGNKLWDVINTIFPLKLWDKADSRAAFYASYVTRHLRKPKLSGQKNGSWGTYFFRLVCFQSAKFVLSVTGKNPTSEKVSAFLAGGSTVNQLERMIEKMSTWSTLPTTAMYCHLSSPVLDAPRTRGGPCLQYIQFNHIGDRKIELVAVYRNHDYFNKALGNFIGLGQLLKFVCEETGCEPGRLVCHASHAFFDISLQKMRELLRID